MKNTAFTLIELLVVVIILGILAAIAIPMYTNAIEQRKGEACINNIRMILAAWQIYNMKGAAWDPGAAYVSVSDINNRLGISVDERNFGQQDSDGTPSGFYVDRDGNILRVRAYRLTGSHNDECIACEYDYNASTFNWSPGADPWVYNWPWLPADA